MTGDVLASALCVGGAAQTTRRNEAVRARDGMRDEGCRSQIRSAKNETVLLTTEAMTSVPGRDTESQTPSPGSARALSRPAY